MSSFLDPFEAQGTPIDDGEIDAIRNSNSALQPIVDDWIESYEDDEGPAMAELVNFVLRVSFGVSPLGDPLKTDPSFLCAQACGCNASVDEHQAQDEDGIVDILDTIQDEFKNVRLLLPWNGPPPQ